MMESKIFCGAQGQEMPEKGSFPTGEKYRHLEDVVRLTFRLLAVPSVSGDCSEAMALVRREFEAMGLTVRTTNKDAVIVTLKGRDDERQRVVSAHLDTLGAVVNCIRPNGRLRIYPIGGWDARSCAGENCLVHTIEGRVYRGSLLPDHASRHAYGEPYRSEAHTFENVEIRLDEAADSREKTEALGISPGDIVSFDTRSEITPTGYLKSRYLDDKLCVAVLVETVRRLTRDQEVLPHTTHFYISNYEEIGHGTPAIPPKTVDVASVDIGIVGEGCASDEHSVTLLSRDAKMPYDRRLMRQLKLLAESEGIPYRIDAYANYGSDATASVMSGKDVRALCFGPGVDASHHYERTHLDSVDATLRLTRAYLMSPLA